MARVEDAICPNAFAKICSDNDICAQWAGKDIDWPDGGVYGFGVTFPPPPNFVPDGQDHRPVVPPAGCLRDPGWNAPLIRAKQQLLGACADTPIPPAQFCGG